MSIYFEYITSLCVLGGGREARERVRTLSHFVAHTKKNVSNNQGGTGSSRSLGKLNSTFRFENRHKALCALLRARAHVLELYLPTRNRTQYAITPPDSGQDVRERDSCQTLGTRECETRPSVCQRKPPRASTIDAREKDHTARARQDILAHCRSQ